jgi:hypothetical protein
MAMLICIPTLTQLFLFEQTLSTHVYVVGAKCRLSRVCNATQLDNDDVLSFMVIRVWIPPGVVECKW